MRRRTSVVLPDPISPVSKENAACDSKPYSSMVIAIPCCLEGYRNAGSGVIEKGLIMKPKWRSYMAAASISRQRVGGPVEHRTDQRRLVQQFDGTHQIVAPAVPFGGAY